MNKGNLLIANGINLGHDPFFVYELLAPLDAPLTFTTDNENEDLVMDGPEDYERVAQAAWLIQQTNISQYIH